MLFRSHYNETQYDPLGTGSEADKSRFRPISLNRTQNSHILQIRNDVPVGQAALMWICLGIPSFTPYVPFYTNADDTDPSYSQTSLEYDIKDAYWMYRTLSMLVEAHYDHFSQKNIDYLTKLTEAKYAFLAQSDAEAKVLSGQALTDLLTEKNHELVALMKKETMQAIAELVTSGLELSKLTFDMDKNL